MAKILCVLCDDPVDGFPTTYARADVPTIERYFDGETTPTPQAVDFAPGRSARSTPSRRAVSSMVGSRADRLHRRHGAERSLPSRPPTSHNEASSSVGSGEGHQTAASRPLRSRWLARGANRDRSA
jgi:hypothetical protein